MWVDTPEECYKLFQGFKSGVYVLYPIFVIDSDPLMVESMMVRNITSQTAYVIHLPSTRIVSTLRSFMTSKTVVKKGLYMARLCECLSVGYFGGLGVFHSCFEYAGSAFIQDSDVEGFMMERFLKFPNPANLPEEKEVVYPYTPTTPPVKFLASNPSVLVESVYDVNVQVNPLPMKVEGANKLYPNLNNLNLVRYIKEYTFSPDPNVYDRWLLSSGFQRATNIANTVSNQESAHKRMLDHYGSTQINTNCASGVDDIAKNDFVRIAVSSLLKKGRTVDELSRPLTTDDDSDRYEPEGAIKWTSKGYKVLEVVKEDDNRKHNKFRLEGLANRLFRRTDVCPMNNIQIGAIVRINLYANDRFRQTMTDAVKRRARHFKYNHTFSRALFRVERIVDGYYFLELVWDPRNVFRFSAWEVNDGSFKDKTKPFDGFVAQPKGFDKSAQGTEVENLWSYEHFQKKMTYGLKTPNDDITRVPFKGFRYTDLLRVDHQTETFMKTTKGREKYESCLKKCMSVGRKRAYEQEKKPTINKSTLSNFGNAETQRANCAKRRVLLLTLRQA